MKPGERKLCILLKAAADHLDSEAESISASFDYNGAIKAAILRCRMEIEECLLGVDQQTITTIESGLGRRLWSIFGKSLDWDHLANNFKLGDEIHSLVEKLYGTNHDT